MLWLYSGFPIELWKYFDLLSHINNDRPFYLGIRKALGLPMPEPPTPTPSVQAQAANTEVTNIDLESELRQFLESEPNLTQSPLRDDQTIEEILMD